jgi:internalin A
VVFGTRITDAVLALEEAEKRIAKEREQKTGALNLRGLELETLPDSIATLSHLRILLLGRDKMDIGLAFGGELDLGFDSDLSFPSMTNPICYPLLNLAVIERLDELIALGLNGCHIDVKAQWKQLAKIRFLDLGYASSVDLVDLSTLPSLLALNLTGIKIEKIAGLDKLLQLQRLNLSETGFQNTKELDPLMRLQKLNLSSNKMAQINDVDKLTQLIQLDLSRNEIEQIEGLNELTQLQSLNLSENEIEQIKGLSKLTQLQNLDLSANAIEQIEGLDKLTELEILNLHSNWGINKIEGLNTLIHLESLDVSDNEIEKIEGLDGMESLNELILNRNNIERIEGLEHLTKLSNLELSGLNLIEFPESLLCQAELKTLLCYESQINNIPPAILSDTHGDNCLERVKQYFLSLKSGHQTISDTKLMVLGNGQIGKTQICRRLCGEVYDPDIPSTHGVLVKQAVLADSEGSQLKLNLWDFGGQEIYHGTHSLFFNSLQTIFLVMWLPDAENQQTHTVGGMKFRNHPLDYWLEHVNQQNSESNTTTTVIVAQTQCDKPQDGEINLPVAVDVKTRFPFVKVVTTSSKSTDGLDELIPAIRKAITYNQQNSSQHQIANSWMRVKTQLEKWITQDSVKPESQRSHQLLSYQSFVELCQGKDEPSLDVNLIVTDAAAETLLHLLHHTGVVFYKKGLFNDQILLDQNWALNAIYAVFHRQAALQRITENMGMFYAEDLGYWLWNEQGHSKEEQALFLQMMQSCGVCFSYGLSQSKKAVYVVPELLPEGEDGYVRAVIEKNWLDKDNEIFSEQYEVNLLHNALFNRILKLIGQRAGEGATYWKNGLLTFESGYKSWLMFERKMHSDWQGIFTLSARGGEAKKLLSDMTLLLEKEQQNWNVQLTKSTKKTASNVKKTIDINQLSFDKSFPEIYISYKWNDKTAPHENREQIVEQFCLGAENKGIKVIRDTTSLQIGDKISAFMERLGAGKRVIVIFSDAYLKSPYCMFELYKVCLNCSTDVTTFAHKVKVFRLQGVQIDSPKDRIQHAIFWKKQFEELTELLDEHGLDVLGKEDFAQYKCIGQFYQNIGDILQEISDTLVPQTFEQLLDYGLAGLQH